MTPVPVLAQLNLVVEDMAATVAFYRTLGLPLEATPGAHHVALHLPDGLLVEFDTTDFVRQWDTGWTGATGGGPVIGFRVDSRAAVDRLYATMTSAGYRGHQLPYDAFWGARYAIIDDPDGHPIGIMSPIDPQWRTWPPSSPPSPA